MFFDFKKLKDSAKGEHKHANETPPARIAESRCRHEQRTRNEALFRPHVTISHGA